MQGGYENYQALMATHRRRIEMARASSVAAGLGNRPRRGRRTLEALKVLRPSQAHVRPGHDPETLFFA